MKTTSLLFSFLVLTISAMSQNPYSELSFPWLKQQFVKDTKVKSILLATMDSDNKTVSRQIMLSFNNQGQLISEESQVGFRYKSYFEYDAEGHLLMQIFNDDVSTDTILFVYDALNRTYIRQTKKKAGPEGWQISETKYQYNELGQINSIEDFSGTVSKIGAPGQNSLVKTGTSVATMNGNVLTMKSSEIVQTFTYDKSGVLQIWSAVNETYGISDVYEYSYDQNGRLVLISWEQMGVGNKTFVTYEQF